MKIAGLNLEDLDELYSMGLINAEISGKDLSYKISFKERFKRWVGRIIKKVKSFFVQDIKANLGDLTISGVFKASECNKPSELVNIIIEDLKLPFPRECDIPKLFFQWDSEIKKIGEMFKNTEIKDSSGGNAYKKAANETPLPPFPILIDQIAQRLHISWQEASNIKWSEVYFMMMIDKRNYIFQKEYDKQIQQKYK